MRLSGCPVESLGRLFAGLLEVVSMPLLGRLRAVLGILERSFGDSGPSWTVLRASWGPPGLSWGPLGPEKVTWGDATRPSGYARSLRRFANLGLGP
eukprot:6091929-Pyramimonas_sp.AAC.1